MTEPILALQWLHSILMPTTPDHNLDDLTGGFHTVVPAGTPSPYGIVRPLTSSEDLTGLDNGVLVWTPVIMQVMLFDREQQDYSRIDPLAQYIYTLLQAKDGSTSGGIIFGCHRVSIEANYELDGDRVQRFIKQHFLIEARSN